MLNLNVKLKVKLKLISNVISKLTFILECQTTTERKFLKVKFKFKDKTEFKIKI